MAMAKTAVGLRLHPETAALTGVRVPDHVDVLAEMACGAQAHMVFSAVTGAPVALCVGGVGWGVGGPRRLGLHNCGCCQSM